MNRNFLLLTLFLCLAASLSAFGAKEKDSGKDAPAVTVIQVTGIVRLVGNANFPELLIENSQASWYIVKDEMNKLYDLQHRTVTVEGEETVRELKFGNGLPAGTRRDLKNIKIISVD
ncbi:MAG: hypothetical protein LBC76_07710 [Treponema sp.]|jgi:hypothetical protein|nr:hypothetical protein [Treponema sp.]